MYAMYNAYLGYMTYSSSQPPEVVQFRAFRSALAQHLDAAQHRREITVVSRRNAVAGALVPMAVLDRAFAHGNAELGLAAAAFDHNGEPLTRDQFAADLTARALVLGGETVQLSAGEADAIGHLLGELAVLYAAEPLGDLAAAWSARLAARTGEPGRR